MKRIPVYEGENPFVFVSYALKDNESVCRILRILHERGLRIWYDDGLEPCSETYEYIASHLDKAEAVIAFITENYVNSMNCCREISFAQMKKKIIIAVFIEKMELSPGKELQLLTGQIMLRCDYASDEDFVEDMIHTSGLQTCITDGQDANPEVYGREDPHSDFSFYEVGSEDFFGGEDEEAGTGFETDWIDALEAADAFDAGSGWSTISAASQDPDRPSDGSSLPSDTIKQTDSAPAEPAEKKKKAGVKKKKPLIALIAAALVLVLTVGICSSMWTGAGPVTYVDSGAPDTLGSLRGVESSLTLKNKHMTADMVRQVNKVRDLSYLSFENCDFEEGALDELRMSPKNNTVTLRFTKCSGMDDLDVLQELDNIYELYINNCDITNVTFPDLSGVTVRNLTVSNCQGISNLSLNTGDLFSINLSGSGINDISFLNGADSLEEINLAHTKVTDLTPLIPLKNLKALNLSGIKMEAFDIELNSLGLEKLRLHDCGLTSTRGLADYTKLVEVDLGGNQLPEVDFLAAIAENLTALDISGNPVKGESLEFLKNAAHMKTLILDHIDLSDKQLSYAQDMKELEKISARDCGLSDISGISGCTELDEILLGFNSISDLEPIAKIADKSDPIHALDLADNEIKDFSVLQGDYINLVLAGNPLENYDCSDPLMSSVLIIDYYDGLETSSLSISSSNIGTPSICGCPRDKQEAVTEALYDPEFESRKDQLTRIRKTMKYLNYGGFEDMFLTISE